jgi:D-arginine dehydrogenase
MSHDEFDVLIIGAGIAGAALGAQIAGDKRVAVLDMEDQPGHHSTGRSAALFAECYGNPVIRSLTRASRDFFFSPPSEFTEDRLVAPRKVLIFGREERREAFEAFVAREIPGSGLEMVDAETALALCPVLKADGLLGGIVDSGSADIEVHALHQSYLRLLKRNGGQLLLRARVEAITFDPSRGWTVTSGAGTLRAKIIVNAAGAWADVVALMAGVTPVGIEPRRRTAALVDLPDGTDAHDWPMILDAEESFYMKPDAGLLLISPADESLSEPEDAQPEELDIAIAADRAETFTTVKIRRIKSSWAGLRTFVKDRSPVVGFDNDRPGFFWMAALGGYGIQTAPALSALAAKLVLDRPVEDDFARLGFTQRDISPARIVVYRSAEAADHNNVHHKQPQTKELST